MIPKVIFKFNKEKDLWNIWDTCNTTSYGVNFKKAVTPNILKICKGRKFEECKKELEKTMNYIYTNNVLKITANSVAEAWSNISREYFQRMEKIMKSQFYTNKVIAYLTTPGRCPYDPDHNPPSFFINIFYGIPYALSTIGEELMHIQFHHSKYWKICEEELGWDKTMDLKEALSVLLNLEFKDLWAVYDEGYSKHTKLRNYIENQWKKEKDFDKLVYNSIKWIKKNGIK